MTKKVKLFDPVTMEHEYLNIHKLYTVISEVFVEGGILVEYY